MTIMFLSSMRLIDRQVNLTEFHLIGPKRNNKSFKSYSDYGTLLHLTPDSVFKCGSVTRY